MNFMHTDSESNEADRYGYAVQQNNISEGEHSLNVFGMYDIAWSKNELMVDESVEAYFQAIGLEDGDEVVFSFYERPGGGFSDELIELVTESINDNLAKVNWKYPQSKLKNRRSATTQSLVFFKVGYRNASAMAQEIPLYADMKLKLESETGMPVKDKKVEIKLSSGRVIRDKTDASGEVTVKKVPPCVQLVRFPELPSAERKDDTVADPFTRTARRLQAYPMGDELNFFRVITLYCYCLHNNGEKRRCVSNTSLFEVVPGLKGDNKYKDVVTILSADQLSLSANGTPLEEGKREAGMYAYKLTCKQELSQKLPEFWKLDFWKGLVVPDEYPVSGLPKSLTVKCYRPDIFKLQIQFPAFKQKKIGVTYEANSAEVASNMVHRRSAELEVSDPKLENKVWTGKCPKPFTKNAPVLMSRNDQEIKLSFLEAVGAVIDLAARVNNVIQAVTDSIPKAGWYYNVENQFFQGTFVLEWGWKEYVDHRAYYYIGANIDLKILEIKFELGVGIDVGLVKLQVFGSLAGNVSISFKGSRISPDGDMELSLPFGAEIIAALNARCEAKSFVKIEGVAETGLKINDGAFKFSQKDGFSVGCALQWTGINVKVTATLKGKKNGEEDADEKAGGTMARELVAPVDLGKWEWPKPDYEYNPPVMPRKDFHELFVKVLTKGTNIRVKKGSSWGLNDYMTADEVAQETENIIHKKRGLKFDGKTAEALALDIREALEDLMEEGGIATFDHMERDEFNRFVNGSELQHILNKYVDSLQEMINAY